MSFVVYDVYERKSWDSQIRDSYVLEEDTRNKTAVFHYTLPTPSYIKQREAEIELYKSVSPALRPYYKILVEEYFKELKTK